MKLPLTTSSPTGLGYVFLGMDAAGVNRLWRGDPAGGLTGAYCDHRPRYSSGRPNSNECGGSNANHHATAGTNGNCRAHRHPGADGYARDHRRPGADGNTRPTAHGNAPSGADARSVGT